MLFLFFGAVGDKVVHHDVGLERETRCNIAIIGRFFVDDRIVAEIKPEPTIFLRHGRAKHAEFARLGPDILRDDAVPRPFVGVGRDFL